MASPRASESGLTLFNAAESGKSWDSRPTQNFRPVCPLPRQEETESGELSWQRNSRGQLMLEYQPILKKMLGTEPAFKAQIKVFPHSSLRENS